MGFLGPNIVNAVYLAAWLDKSGGRCAVVAGSFSAANEIVEAPIELGTGACGAPKVASGYNGAVAWWSQEPEARVRVLLNPLSEDRIAVDVPTSSWVLDLAVAGSPTHVAVVWAESQDLAWTVIDRQGRAGEIVRVPLKGGGSVGSLRVASDGQSFTVMVGEGFLAYSPWFVSFDRDGEVTGITEQLGEYQFTEGGAVVWNGTEYLALFGPTLLPLGAGGSSPGVAIELPSVVHDAAPWRGRLLVIFSRFESFDQFFFQRTFQLDGQPLSDVDEDIAGPGRSPSLSPDGEFLAYAHPSYAGGLDVRVVEVLGKSALPLSTGWNRQWQPAIGSNGDTFLVAWSEARGSDEEGEVYCVRVSVAGEILDDAPVPISPRPGPHYGLSVLSDGDGFLVLFRTGYPWEPEAPVLAVPVGRDGEVGDPVGMTGTPDAVIEERPGGYLRAVLGLTGIQVSQLSSRGLPGSDERTYEYPDEPCLRIRAWTTSDGELLACQYSRPDPVNGAEWTLSFLPIDEAGTSMSWTPPMDFTGRLAWSRDQGVAVDFVRNTVHVFDRAGQVTTSHDLPADLSGLRCREDVLATHDDDAPFLLWWGTEAGDPATCSVFHTLELDRDGNAVGGAVELPRDLLSTAWYASNIPIADAGGHELIVGEVFDSALKATRTTAQFIPEVE